MSKNPIDKWLDAMEFEMFRLKSTYEMSTEILESRIKQLESMPVTKGTRNNFKEKNHQLVCLKQDLQSLRVLESSYRKIKQAREQMREKGFHDPGLKVHEIHSKYDTIFEKMKIEQRERQWQHLASLRQLWPKADDARKRRMVGLFAKYAGMRLGTGITNSLLVIPQKMARWFAKGYKRRTGLR